MSVQMTCPFCKNEFPFDNGELDRQIAAVGQRINQINRELAKIKSLPRPVRERKSDRRKCLVIEFTQLSQKISELKTIRKATDQQIRHYEYEEFKAAVKERFGDDEYKEIICVVQERIKAYKISGLMRHEYTRSASKPDVTSINKL